MAINAKWPTGFPVGHCRTTLESYQPPKTFCATAMMRFDVSDGRPLVGCGQAKSQSIARC